MAAAIACAAVGKRYANGVLGIDDVTLEVAAYAVAVCWAAGRRFASRDLLLS